MTQPFRSLVKKALEEETAASLAAPMRERFVGATITRPHDRRSGGSTLSLERGSTGSMTAEEPRGVRRPADTVTVLIDADGKKRGKRIRSRAAGVKACHPSTEKSFRCACFRFHQWGSGWNAQNAPPTLSCPCGRMHHRGEGGPLTGSEWYDHNGQRKPCPGQDA